MSESLFYKMPQRNFLCRKMSYVALGEMFLRQLCKMSSIFANPISLRRLKGIFQRCFQGAFYHCFENHHAKMSKNCLYEMSYLPLYEMSFRQPCKISSRFANPISFRRLKDILPRCLECLHKTSLRCLFADWASFTYIMIFVRLVIDVITIISFSLRDGRKQIARLVLKYIF